MRPQHILVDANTRRVLAVTPFQAVAIQLQRITPQSWWFPDAQFPNYQNAFPLQNVNQSEYVQWIWNAEKRTLTNSSDAADPDTVSRSELAGARCAALTRMILVLSTIRAEFDTGVALQDGIYAEKARQARLVTEHAAEPHAPYVEQHATLTGMTLEQAAADILFAAKLSHETMLRTEGLRMKYNVRLRDTKTPDEVYTLLRDFLKEARSDTLN